MPYQPITNAFTNALTNPNNYSHLALPIPLPTDYQLKPKTLTKTLTNDPLFGKPHYQSMKSEHKLLILVDNPLIRQDS